MPYKENEEGLRITGDYSIKRLWGIHKEVCRLHVYGNCNGRDIAAMLNITPQTVYNILGSEKGKDEIARLSEARDEKFEDVQRRLEQLAPFALDTLEEALLTDDEQVTIPVKVGIAKDLLDRAGHKPVTQVTLKSVSHRIDGKFLEEVRKRAEELKAEIKRNNLAEDPIQEAEVVETTEVTNSTDGIK